VQNAPLLRSSDGRRWYGVLDLGSGNRHARAERPPRRLTPERLVVRVDGGCALDPATCPGDCRPLVLGAGGVAGLADLPQGCRVLAR